MKVGFIGLGKMGVNLVLRLREAGVEVVFWNRSDKDEVERVVKVGAIRAKTFEELVNKLEGPRVVWVMLTAGEPTNQAIEELSSLLSNDDLVIDGGNSFYKNSQSNYQTLKKLGIHFMDIGTSGGPKGAREGACLMVGGDREDSERVEELLKIIAAPEAYAYLGPSGAGHFAKMVHNGIEYGMMQSIAEGAAVLKKSDLNFDLSQVFELYNHRSVIESRLVEWMKEAFEEDPNLDSYSSKINHSGEGEWTVNTAKELEVEVPVIETSLQVRRDSAEFAADDKKYNSLRSQESVSNITENNRFRNAAVSALRGKFGGHSVKKNS